MQSIIEVEQQILSGVKLSGGEKFDDQAVRKTVIDFLKKEKGDDALRICLIFLANYNIEKKTFNLLLDSLTKD